MDYQTQSWSDLWYYLVGVATSIPLWLAYLAGIVISFYHWRRHPKIARLTLAAFVMFALNALIGILLNYFINFKIRSGGWELRTVTTVSAISSVITSLMGAVGFALLLIAIFSQRSPRITDAETLKLP
jgi:hypothetical protein